MRLTPTTERTSSQVAGPVVRDRLQTFRRLCLALALFTVGGVAIALGFLPEITAGHRLETMLSAALLMGVWLYGYRREHFPNLWLPVEVVLLGGLVHGVANLSAVLGVCYVGVQFRSLYGARRDAVWLGVAYISAFLVGLAFMPGGPGIMRPIVIVEITAIGFCAYIMHTLAQILERDVRRTDELRRSKVRYRTLFENSPWPMWVVDPGTLRILDVNQAAIRHYDYSREEFLAMTLRELRRPEDLPTLERLRPAIESEQRFTSLVRHRKRDGSTIDVEITSDVIDFDDRRARIAVGVDVTQRERTEQALRESEQRFRAVAENLREALMITDIDDRIILANSRVREVLGYDPDDVLGKSATELLLPPSQRNAFKDRLRRRLEGETELYEVELVCKDGTHIFAEVSASPYRDASGRIIGTLGAISDVSEQKRLAERLRHAQRMEAVGQLAGGVAHDFNNLLTVIKCHTELLLGELRRDDPSRDGVAEIARAAHRGALLTQQLLAYSRKLLLQPRRVGLAHIVAESLPMLRRQIRSSVTLVSVADDSAVEVFADPLQLEQVLVTLVRNANDAMPKGGRISIETQTLEMSDVHLSVGTQEMPRGRYALLSVADTGVGMPHDVQARLFEPFFTTKEPGEGTGLGLASMYGIVRQSGGFVDVESSPNAGTTFRVYLPLASTPRLESPPSSALQMA